MRIGFDERNTSRGSETRSVSPRLANAAHEFEAQMMKELLMPMTARENLTGEADDSKEGTGSGGALEQFASEALAQAISRHGGFGIANRILHELSQPGQTSVGGNFRHTGTGNLK